jgi:hypothetical protein
MKNKLLVLKSEILQDLGKLDRLFERFETSYDRYSQRKEYSILVESAFYVNRLYTGFERIFQNIAAVFENTIEKSSWHKSLLDRIAIPIENIRPAVISKDNYGPLNELRAFRHFFRHTYDFDLEDEKFAIVASKTRELKKTYKKDTEKFLRFIDDLLED